MKAKSSKYIHVKKIKIWIKIYKALSFFLFSRLSSLEEIIPLELIEKNKQDFKPIVGYRKLLLQWSKSKTFNKGRFMLKYVLK